MFHPIEYVQEKRARRKRKKRAWAVGLALLLAAAAAIGTWLATRRRHLGAEGRDEAGSLPGTGHVAREEEA